MADNCEYPAAGAGAGHAGDRRPGGRRFRTPGHTIAAMDDTPPDRLALNPRSPYFDAGAIDRGVGIRFKGDERHDVEEYCVSEGWIRVAAGKARDRRGNPMTLKLQGEVVAYFIAPA